MCVIHCWLQLSCLTLPAGVRVSSVIFQQVGSSLQFSRSKTVTDNCSQHHFHSKLSQDGTEKNYGNLAGPIRSRGGIILAQRGNTVWWQITWFIGHSGAVNVTSHCERDGSHPVCGNRRGGVSDAGDGVWLVGRISVVFISSSGNHHLLLIRVVKGSWILSCWQTERVNTPGGAL